MLHIIPYHLSKEMKDMLILFLSVSVGQPDSIE